MTTNNEVLMSVDDLAAYLGVPVATVRRWRYTGTDGPRSMKVGRHVRYRRADVDRWLEQHATPTAS